MKTGPGGGGWCWLLAAGAAASLGAADPPASGPRLQFAKWAPIELHFQAPQVRAEEEGNPFAVALDVAFTGPQGTTVTVPGFHDGDGQGGQEGRVWKVRFAADRPGRWTYATRSPHPQLNGRVGEFLVTAAPPDARGFWKWGRLEAVGTTANKTRYLKFRDGPYWLKAGCDDPENFLGRYRHFRTPAQRRAAVDYLAGHGINSLYIMTHNLGGDDKDVWPWLGDTAGEAMRHGGAGRVRFDVPRLAAWRELFVYMQDRGVVPYLVLEDDSAWKDYDHDRYYREMIARFGDLPALVFNLGEEHNENYRLDESLDLARRFKEVDPYGHPLGIHNVNQPTDAYIDSPYVDFTAIQTGSPGSGQSVDHALAHNRIAVDWIQRCRQRGRRVLVVNFDEGRPELDRRAWWSAYLGGGVWEAHVLPPYDRPHSAWESVWVQLGGARAFMETLPFWDMAPRNDLVRSGRAFCLAQPAGACALYLPLGGPVTVDLPQGVDYEADWWMAEQGRGGSFQNRHLVSGGRASFMPPAPGDWALRLRPVTAPQADPGQ